MTLEDYSVPALKKYFIDPVAAAVLRDLDRGKWRPARDGAKILCKKQTDEFFPLLIGANLGLFRSLLEKRLLNDALPVLENLRALLHSELTDQLENELKVAETRKDKAKLGQESSGLMERLWPLAAQMANLGVEPTPEQIALLDDVVLAFQPPPVTLPIPPGEEAAGVTPEQQLAREILAIQKAAAAAAGWQWEACREALQVVGGRSVLRHWRVFFRGMRLVMEGQKSAAEEVFARLPEASATRLAGAVMVNEASAAQVRPAARAGWWLASAGLPREWGAALAAAHRNGEKGEWTQALDDLLTGLGSQCIDFSDPFFRSLCNEFFTLNNECSEEMDEKAEAFFHALPKYGKANDFTVNTAAKLALNRAVFQDCQKDPELLEEVVAEFLGLMAQERSVGADAWRTVVVNKLAADAFLNAYVDGRLSFFNNHNEEAMREKNLKSALMLLEKSNKLEPRYREAWDARIQATEQFVRNGRIVPILEEASAHFPDDFGFLITAGRHCLEAGTYDKAAKFYAQALALDPMNLTVRESVMAQVGELLIARTTSPKNRTTLWKIAQMCFLEKGAAQAASTPLLQRWLGLLWQLHATSDSATQQALWEEILASGAPPDHLYLAHQFLSDYFTYCVRPRKPRKRKGQKPPPPAPTYPKPPALEAPDHRPTSWTEIGAWGKLLLALSDLTESTWGARRGFNFLGQLLPPPLIAKLTLEDPAGCFRVMHPYYQKYIEENLLLFGSSFFYPIRETLNRMFEKEPPHSPYLFWIYLQEDEFFPSLRHRIKRASEIMPETSHDRELNHAYRNLLRSFEEQSHYWMGEDEDEDVDEWVEEFVGDEDDEDEDEDDESPAAAPVKKPAQKPKKPKKPKNTAKKKAEPPAPDTRNPQLDLPF